MTVARPAWRSSPFARVSSASSARTSVAIAASEAWVSDLSTGSARRRLLQLLVRLSAHADASCLIWLPRRDEIGAMLDMKVETASRLISALRRDGVIELAPSRSARLDAATLQQALRAEDAT